MSKKQSQEQQTVVDSNVEPVVKVEDIPFEPEPETNDKAVVVREPDRIMFAVGIELTPEATDQEIDRVVELVQSYIGVKPRKVGDYLNMWLPCIGCIIAPFERARKRKDSNGEEYTSYLRWKAPLFKLLWKDEVTGQHVIITGGGQNAMDFAKRYAHLGRAGDWRYPKEILFSQEERQITDEATGEVKPGRMYRIDVRSPQIHVEEN